MSRFYEVNHALKEEILDELCYIKNNAVQVVEAMYSKQDLDAPLYHYSVKYEDGKIWLMSNFSTTCKECVEELYSEADALEVCCTTEFDMVKGLV